MWTTKESHHSKAISLTRLDAQFGHDVGQNIPRPCARDDIRRMAAKGFSISVNDIDIRSKAKRGIEKIIGMSR